MKNNKAMRTRTIFRSSKWRNEVNPVTAIEQMDFSDRIEDRRYFRAEPVSIQEPQNTTPGSLTKMVSESNKKSLTKWVIGVPIVIFVGYLLFK